MTRQKAADELFCRSCGVAIKKQVGVCPHCGVSTEQFPGFEPEPHSVSRPETAPRSSNTPSESRGGSAFDRLLADMKMGDKLGPIEPYTAEIGMVGGIILILFGVASFFSAIFGPGAFLMESLGSMLMIAGGVFALPQIREEIRPELAETSIETPLDPGVVMYISLVLYVFGWLLTA